jgi:hypothetical protein
MLELMILHRVVDWWMSQVKRGSRWSTGRLSTLGSGELKNWYLSNLGDEMLR